jgi:nicotinamide phosphoribosyltransferase
MAGLEAAQLSAAGHLLSFTGTDTIPTIDFLETYYNADSDKELIGGSVAATEHSVMCMGTDVGEQDTFKRLITEVYPKGIVSIVSDTWDLWKVLTEYLPQLKEEVLAREGKVVIRPDSGNPVDIICGDPKATTLAAQKGVIELLWEIFGGTTNAKGFKELDSHIGAIYGDSITLERATQICERLKQKGFASTNVVLGIGSFTYQYNTRDTFGFAMKATYGEVEGMGREIYKDPITDDGTKKSAKGLLQVLKENDTYILKDQISWEEEQQGALKVVYKNGKLLVDWSLQEIRDQLKL